MGHLIVGIFLLVLACLPQMLPIGRGFYRCLSRPPEWDREVLRFVLICIGAFQLWEGIKVLVSDPVIRMDIFGASMYVELAVLSCLFVMRFRRRKDK
jgi:hypothetical protein